MGDVTGKVILVIGGTEESGPALVQNLLNEGATVIVLSSSKRQAELLRRRLDSARPEQLVTLVIQPDKLGSMTRLRDHIRRRFGGVDSVMALPHSETLVETLVCQEKKEAVLFL